MKIIEDFSFVGSTKLPELPGNVVGESYNKHYLYSSDDYIFPSQTLDDAGCNAVSFILLRNRAHLA